jgi:hypothetical protein
MWVLLKARKITVLFAVIVILGIIIITVYVYSVKSVTTSRQLSAPVQTDSRSIDQIEDRKPSSGEPLPLGRLLGENNPAVPPITMHVGRPPGEADAPDLSTPAEAVYSVLSLIDQAATDQLATCFIEQTEEPMSTLYPRYLGRPLELVEVIEDGESAKVVWNATVHTMFSLDGRDWSAGEMFTLTTKLVRVEGLWKLLKLYEGNENDSQQNDK